jgi:hypothetical protein
VSSPANWPTVQHFNLVSLWSTEPLGPHASPSPSLGSSPSPVYPLAPVSPCPRAPSRTPAALGRDSTTCCPRSAPKQKGRRPRVLSPGPRPLLLSTLSTCQLVLPSGPPANSSTGQLTRRLLPPCHRAHLPPRGDFRRRATPSAPARDTGSRRADPASPARRRSPPPALLRRPRATPSGCGRCAPAGPCACRRTDW